MNGNSGELHHTALCPKASIWYEQDTYKTFISLRALTETCIMFRKTNAIAHNVNKPQHCWTFLLQCIYLKMIVLLPSSLWKIANLMCYPSLRDAMFPTIVTAASWLWEHPAVFQNICLGRQVSYWAPYGSGLISWSQPEPVSSFQGGPIACDPLSAG